MANIAWKEELKADFQGKLHVGSAMRAQVEAWRTLAQELHDLIEHNHLVVQSFRSLEVDVMLLTSRLEELEKAVFPEPRAEPGENQEGKGRGVGPER